MAIPTGKWSALLPATQEIYDICNQVQGESEVKSGEFFPYAYKQQLRDGGATYLVKVYVGQMKCQLLTIEDMLTEIGNTYTLKSIKEIKPYGPIEV